MRFCTMTLGCKVNQYETGAIESLLCERGHELKIPGEGCDVCIINTCAVTAESVRKTRQAIRRMKKLEPNAKIAVLGCYSELEPEEIAKIGADLISGTKDRHEFALKAEKLTPSSSKTSAHHPSSTANFPLSTLNSPLSANPATRTRALLKIQDGCDNYCAYCIVPYARGPSRSLPLESIAEHAKKLEKQGYKEIVITGIEISSYGKDLNCTDQITPNSQLSTTKPSSLRAHEAIQSPNLLTAIQTIRTATPNSRLRLGSLDPAALTDGFIKKLKETPNICNHFHLSLQSGCDETLHRMNRKYNTSQVQQVITALRAHFPDCAITADLITGFPGETEEEFNKTLIFIKKANFSDMHIFPFSPRPGTKASIMPDQIEKSTRKDRARIAKKTANEMSDSFKKAQIGKTVKSFSNRKKTIAGQAIPAITSK